VRIACHIPPLSDQQLHARMKATLGDAVLNSLSDWLCRRCVKKRKNIQNSVSASTEHLAIGQTLVTQPAIRDPRPLPSQDATLLAAAKNQEPAKITQGVSPHSAFQPYVSPLIPNYAFLQIEDVDSQSLKSHQMTAKIVPVQQPSHPRGSNFPDHVARSDSIVSPKNGGTFLERFPSQSSIQAMSHPSARFEISVDDHSEDELPAPRFPHEHPDMSPGGDFFGPREVTDFATSDLSAMDTDEDLEGLYYTAPDAEIVPLPGPSLPPNSLGNSLTPTLPQSHVNNGPEAAADRLCTQWIRDRHQDLWSTSRGTKAPRRKGKVQARTNVGGDTFVFTLENWIRTHT
jgi:hypothetical protein